MVMLYSLEVTNQGGQRQGMAWLLRAKPELACRLPVIRSLKRGGAATIAVQVMRFAPFGARQGVIYIGQADSSSIFTFTLGAAISPIKRRKNGWL
jgi:hypothetical protein